MKVFKRSSSKGSSVYYHGQFSVNIFIEAVKEKKEEPKEKPEVNERVLHKKSNSKGITIDTLISNYLKNSLYL